jgi:DNA replication protein DnaC
MEMLKINLPEHESVEKRSVSKSKSLEELNVEKYNNAKEECFYCPCPKCNGKGYIAFLNELGIMQLKKCTCFTTRANRKKFVDLQLYDYIKMFDGKLDKVEDKETWQRQMKECAKAYLEDNDGKNWLLLCGQSGSGKTTIETLVAYNLTAKYPNAKIDYINWDTDWQSLVGLYNQEEKMIRINQLQTVDILIIDDFLRHRDSKLTENERNLAKAIIDYRYKAKNITLITSELSINQLLQIDEAIGGRIIERCKKTYFVSVKEDSTRNYRTRELYQEV